MTSRRRRVSEYGAALQTLRGRAHRFGEAVRAVDSPRGHDFAADSFARSRGLPRAVQRLRPDARVQLRIQRHSGEGAASAELVAGAAHRDSDATRPRRGCGRRWPTGDPRPSALLRVHLSIFELGTRAEIAPGVRARTC